MTIRLSALVGLMVLGIAVINLLFGTIYWATGGVGGVRHGDFADAVFFSVQTFSTTGYGVFYPQSLLANAVASVEIVIGLLATALATGLLFARLSRPQARVMFSRVAVIHEQDGVPTLMFRIANRRRNALTDARMTVTITHDEADAAGTTMRRLIDLRLERDRSPALALSWTVMHRITPDSPLAGLDRAALRRLNVVFLCVLVGIDETLLATVVSRHLYDAGDIRFGARLADIFARDADGGFTIDYTRFHEAEDVALPAAGGVVS